MQSDVDFEGYGLLTTVVKRRMSKQEELLRWYCQLDNISVNQIIFEDHSAKTFTRRRIFLSTIG